MTVLNSSSTVHYHFQFSKPHKALHKIALDTKALSRYHEQQMEEFSAMTNEKTHHLSIPVLIQQKITHMREMKALIESSEVHLNAIGDQTMIKNFRSQIRNLESHIQAMENQKLEAFQHLEQGKHFAEKAENPEQIDPNLEVVKNADKYTRNFNFAGEEDANYDAEAEQETVNNVSHASQSPFHPRHNLSTSDVNNATKICFSTIGSAYPPEFCWKRGGDFGVIPTGCPSGFFRSLALCYEYCRKGYTFVLGVCWHDCQRGTDIGALCVDWFYVHAKHTYMSTPLTNFSSRVPCPYNRYRSLALCYKDCKAVGMTNCGIGACSRDSVGCGLTIMNMVFEMINTLISVTSLILTFGASGAATTGLSAAKTALKNAGKKALKTSFSGIKNYIKKNGTTYIKNRVKDSLKDAAMNKAIASSIGGICNEMADGLAGKVTARQSFDVDYFIDKVDIIGVGAAVSSCKNPVTENEKIACAQAILSTAGNFDPTGILCLAAAFTQPICDIPMTKPANSPNPVGYTSSYYKPTVKVCGVFETKNSAGPHRCSSDAHCDGTRICNREKWCEGISGCKTENCDVDEYKNAEGPNKCKTHAHCAGNRTCSDFGYCRGVSGCKGLPSSDPNFLCQIDEAINKRGSNRCYKAYECSGNRYCSGSGWCHGDSGCDGDRKKGSPAPAPSKPAGCGVDESRNRRGAHKCYNSSECDGKRTCSGWGWCQGSSGCRRLSSVPEATELPKERCMKVFSECDFHGESEEICDTGKGANLKKWKNRVASVIVGSSTSVGLFDESWQQFTKDYDGAYLALSRGQQYNCLKVNFGEKWNNTALSYKFDINQCFLLFEEAEFGGAKELVCNKRNLSLLSNKAKSMQKFNLESKVILYTEKNFKGEQKEFTDLTVEDLGNSNFQSARMEMVPPPDCVLISDEINFEGRQRILCDQQNELSGNWDNTVDSIKVGSNVHKAAFLDHSNKDSKYMVLEAGAVVQNLNETHKEVSDNISSVYLNVERCVILYNEVNYQGSNKMFCGTADFDEGFENNVKSIQVDFTPHSEYYMYFYTEKDQMGDKVKVDDDVADVSKLAFTEFSSFLLVNKETGVY